MYCIWDIETTIFKSFKRKANPFDPRNWIVAHGWKHAGAPRCSWEYRKQDMGRVLPESMDLTDTKILVGANIKFDLLYNWRDPRLQDFFKRGGWVWDVLYAEYLLSGQHQKWQLNSEANLNSLAAKYGGTQKIDAVKAMWEQGINTPDIPEDLLVDYLVGSEAEGRNAGDIGNTEIVFLAQVARAKELGMLKAIKFRMDGLCSTTEMEYNGLKVDIQQARKNMEKLSLEEAEIMQELEQYLPKDLPKELTFSWTNGRHLSAIIFGGAVRYEKRMPVLDEAGQFQYTKGKTIGYSLHGEWIPLMDFDQEISPYADVYASGKKKGEIKTKMVEIPGYLKTRMEELVYSFPQQAKPDPDNATKNVDPLGAPVYKTDEDSLEEIPDSAAPFMKRRKRLGSIIKELSTYYVRVNKQGKLNGMLTCVDPSNHMVHPSLNHNATKTTRLAGSNPNPQNLPRKENGTVKQVFISRFGPERGLMIEYDYSQLEVIVLQVLCQDPKLAADIIKGVDFHCVRVSAWKGCTYEEAVEWCKNEEHPKYKEWEPIRSDAKVFSFQRAYGAGVKKIAATTGMKEEDVQALIYAEELLYPGVAAFHAKVAAAVEASAKPFYDSEMGRMFRSGFWQSPTGCIYSWRSWDAPAFLKKRGITDTFKPTELKNFPTQGTGGEFVQGVAGILWRHFLACDNYGGLALLCNTVHDCFWVDTDKSVTLQVIADMKRIMESIPEVYNREFNMGITVPFRAEAEVGYNMYDMHHPEAVFANAA